MNEIKSDIRVARTQLLASRINFGTSKTQLKFTHVKNDRVGMMDMTSTKEI